MIDMKSQRIMAMVAVMAVCVAQAAVETVGDQKWRYQIIDGEAEIMSYFTYFPAPKGSVTIPSFLGGVPVRRIGYQAFRGCSELTSVSIPDGVANIGSEAFSYCSALAHVSIPSSVTNIGDSAFGSCGALRNVNIPSGIQNIGTTAFAWSGLECVTVPGSVKNIGHQAFYGCENLAEVVLGSGVERIAALGFSKCNALTNVTISVGVTSIGSSAFEDCGRLQSIAIPVGVAELGSSLFANCSNMTKVVISNGVTSIKSHCFKNCRSLAIVVLPDSITEIETDAFTDCASLSTITIPCNVTQFGFDRYFSGCSSLVRIDFKGPPPWCASAWEYPFPQIAGTYLPEHAESWLAVINPDTGCWRGLTMTVYEPPPLTLSVESADWSRTPGTITLKCEDLDTSGAEHSYWLMYYEEMEPEKRWHEIFGAANVKANTEVDSNGNSLLVAHLTDGRFSERMDGLRTVKYQVCDENGRLSNVCTTRRRHGLFVALDEYEGGWQKAHSTHSEQASSFIRAYQEHGDALGCFCRMFNSGAKKSLLLRELDYLADEVAAPGDVLVFYYVGHGGEHFVTCYGRGEKLYASELTNRLDRLAGVGNVVILNTCHSASMISQSDTGDGMGNIGWLVSSQANEESRCGSFTDCVLDRGWLKGAADVYGEGMDGYVTFGELASWGQEWTAKNYIRDGQLITHYNSLVLDNIVAGRVPNHASWTPLAVGPISLTAKPGTAGEIDLRWSAVAGATGYDVYCRYKSPVASSYWHAGGTSGTSYIVGRTFALVPDYEYEFYIRAKNDVDVSEASPTASCSPQENVELRDYVSRYMTTERIAVLPQSSHPAIENGEVVYENMNYDHDGDGFTTFEEYVAGTDPADGENRFLAAIAFSNGMSSITWSPNLNTNGEVRTYTVWGKTNLTDEVWHTPTNSASRFFKVTVDMP